LSQGESQFTVADLDYDLPPERIAQFPLPRREDSRMLIVNRKTGAIRDSFVRNLPELLNPKDLVVLNDTRVLPARFTATRATGGLIEGLFLQEDQPGTWRVMLERSRRLKIGEILKVGESASTLSMTLIDSLGEGHWQVQLTSRESPEIVLSRVGQTPLPPYIRRGAVNSATDSVDRERYQTVYARIPGAVAAPTAGLHLTQETLDSLRDKRVEVATVTLHVGAGTFKPILSDTLADHVMHSEEYQMPEGSVTAWNTCRNQGGRVTAVGTTVVRVLETVFGGERRDLNALRGSTNIFMYPPYRFEAVDMLLTNFHLPRSTLLSLVMAFAGVELTRRAYVHAIEKEYRFYSYGDAMFIE